MAKTGYAVASAVAERSGEQHSIELFSNFEN